MDDQSSGLSRSLPGPGPSWPTVIAATVRLWIQRHRRIFLGGMIAVVCLGLAAVLTVTAIEVGAASPSPGAAGSASQTVIQDASRLRAQAAEWIADQVDSDAIVACDPAMCAALETAGLQADSLLMVGTSATDPLGSDLVVATPALRTQFGTRLESVFAPLVIASFGSGASRIDIRVTAADGGTAYQAGMARELAARITAGSQLLRNRSITVSAAAREALRSGEVDPRLLLTLAALAAQQRVRIVSFSDPSPGTSPLDVPYRAVTLAPARSTSKLTAGLGSMSAFLNAQQSSFRPSLITNLGTALSVEYGAPSPLGLLS
jgi:hypothetical protein